MPDQRRVGASANLTGLSMRRPAAWPLSDARSRLWSGEWAQTETWNRDETASWMTKRRTSREVSPDAKRSWRDMAGDLPRPPCGRRPSSNTSSHASDPTARSWRRLGRRAPFTFVERLNLAGGREAQHLAPLALHEERLERAEEIR